MSVAFPSTGTPFAPESVAPQAPRRQVPKTNFRPDGELLDETLAPRVGDKVFWFPRGDVRDQPHVAFVALDSNFERCLCLSVLYPGITGMIAKEAVKHYSANPTELDKERNGVWAWNRTPLAWNRTPLEPSAAPKGK